MKCKRHPNYKANREPRADCATCREMRRAFLNQQIANAHVELLRLWWAREFAGRMPKLDHSLVQEAIRLNEPPIAPGQG